MNYYAKGGEAHGLGNLNDTYSRGVQYKDGVPSFGIGGSLRKAWKGTVGKVEDIAKPITEPITDAIKPILPYVQYIAPFIPGVGTAMAVGLGALGSGFAGGGGFNLKRGIMGGITAYGMSNLAQGLSAAGNPSAAASGATAPPPVELGVPGTDVVAGEVARTGLTEPGIMSQLGAGDISGAVSNIASSGADAVRSGFNAITSPETYKSLGDSLTTQGKGLTNLVSGDKAALSAFGDKFGMGSAGAIMMGTSGQAAINEFEKAKLEADLQAAKSETERNEILARIEASRRRGEEAVRRNPYMFAQGGEVPRYFGGALIKELVGNIKSEDQQRAELAKAGVNENILADADRAKVGEYYRSLYGSKAAGGGGLGSLVQDLFSRIRASSPNQEGGFSLPATNVPAPTEDQRSALIAMINNPFKYAYGGSVDDEPGTDDLSAGGIASMAAGGMPPRFLSGGGDGMSDDIPATINGKQPARLADGEFVIPADVVSHLGNGSSKAGAKQLYSMMDRVRKARTGTTKQGKEIKPTKFMPV